MAKKPYDLILMDCHMPIVDGFAATKKIRQQEESGQRTPIIAMTADIQKGIIQRCTDSGMDDYLSKPYNTNTLRKMMAKWLTTPKTNDAIEPKTDTQIASIQGSEILDAKQIETLRQVGAATGRNTLAHVAKLYLQEAPKLLEKIQLAT